MRREVEVTTPDLPHLCAELRRLRAAADDNPPKNHGLYTSTVLLSWPVLVEAVERLTAENQKLRDQWLRVVRDPNNPTELSATRAKLDRLVAAAPSTSETKDEWLRRHHSAQTDFEELAWGNLMDWRAAIADAGRQP